MAETMKTSILAMAQHLHEQLFNMDSSEETIAALSAVLSEAYVCGMRDAEAYAEPYLSRNATAFHSLIRQKTELMEKPLVSKTEPSTNT